MDRSKQALSGLGTLEQALLAIGVILAAHSVLMLCGCGSSPTDELKPTGIPAEGSEVPRTAALQRVEKMAAGYRNASSYSDQGQLTLTTRPLKSQGKLSETTQTWECSLVLLRPNRFRIQVRGTTVIGDGRHLWARLPSGAIARGQVLQRAAPTALSFASLFEPSLLNRGQPSLLTGALAGGVGGQPFQLHLLATDGTIDPLLGAKRIALLPAQQIDGRMCDVVEFHFEATNTRSTLWIDQQSNLLRRLVFPDTLVGEGDGQSVRSLVADFHDATLSGPVDEKAFQFEVKPDERRVKQFVATPPEAPLHLLGKPINNLTLVRPDGKTMGAGSLAGHVSVLVFFGSDDPNSLAALPQLMAVGDRLKTSQAALKIAAKMIAVSTDPLSLTDRQLQQNVGPLLAGGTLYRAPHIRTNNTLGIKTLPTTLVLGPQGVVEYLQPGFSDTAPRKLAEAIGKIAAGESLHQQNRAEFDRERKRYQNMLNEVSSD